MAPIIDPQSDFRTPRFVAACAHWSGPVVILEQSSAGNGGIIDLEERSE